MKIELLRFAIGKEETLDVAFTEKGIVKIKGEKSDATAGILFGKKIQYSGQICIDGRDIKELSESDWRQMRRDSISIVDSYIGKIFDDMKLSEFAEMTLSAEGLEGFHELIEKKNFAELWDMKLCDIKKNIRDILSLLIAISSGKKTILVCENKLYRKKIDESLLSIIDEYSDKLLFIVAEDTDDSRLRIEIDADCPENDSIIIGHEKASFDKKEPFLYILKKLFKTWKTVLLIFLAALMGGVVSAIHTDKLAAYEEYFNKSESKIVMLRQNWDYKGINDEELEMFGELPYIKIFAPKYLSSYYNLKKTSESNKRCILFYPSNNANDVVTTDCINDFPNLFSLSFGRLPEDDSEILIDDYYLEFFKRKGMVTLNNGTFSPEELTEDCSLIVGSEINVGTEEKQLVVTISGILDTVFDANDYKDYFDYADWIDDNMDDQEYREWSSSGKPVVDEYPKSVDKEKIEKQMKKYEYERYYSLLGVNYMHPSTFQRILNILKSDGIDLKEGYGDLPKSVVFETPTERDAQRIFGRIGELECGTLRLYSYESYHASSNVRAYENASVIMSYSMIFLFVLAAIIYVIIAVRNLDAVSYTFSYLKEIGYDFKNGENLIEILVVLLQTIPAFPISLLFSLLFEFIICPRFVAGISFMSVITPFVFLTGFAIIVVLLSVLIKRCTSSYPSKKIY